MTWSGESLARAVVLELVHQSQWFSLTPLPDDLWELCVKEENQERLALILANDQQGRDT